jgi:hypothetical protein
MKERANPTQTRTTCPIRLHSQLNLAHKDHFASYGKDNIVKKRHKRLVSDHAASFPLSPPLSLATSHSLTLLSFHMSHTFERKETTVEWTGEGRDWEAEEKERKGK